MSTPSERGDGDEDRRRRRAAGWYGEGRTPTLVVGLLAGLLAVGTTIGIVQAAGSDGTDRVAPSSTAPVYGAR